MTRTIDHDPIPHALAARTSANEPFMCMSGLEEIAGVTSPFRCLDLPQERAGNLLAEFKRFLNQIIVNLHVGSHVQILAQCNTRIKQEPQPALPISNAKFKTL